MTRLGNSIDALTDFKRALEIKPNEVRAYFEMGNVHLGKGDYSSIFDAYRAAASIDANNPDLQRTLGLALSERGGSINLNNRDKWNFYLSSA